MLSIIIVVAIFVFNIIAMIVSWKTDSIDIAGGAGFCEFFVAIILGTMIFEAVMAPVKETLSVITHMTMEIQ